MKKLYLVLLVTFQSLQTVNIKLLKGTHTIASPDYSPVMGISFLEWRIAEQWYILSPKNQVKEFEEKLKQNPDNVGLQKFVQQMKKRKNTATEDLVSEMYHMVEGSFSTTNADGNPVKHLKPEHIGTILRIVQKWDGLLTNQAKFKVYKDSVENELTLLAKSTSRLSAELKALEIKLSTESNEKNKSEMQSQIAAKKLIFETDKSRQQYLNKVKSAKNGYELLNLELTNMLTGLGIEVGKSGKQWSGFVNALTGSLKESHDGVYAKNTAQELVLSYLLAKANTKNDLLEYFRGFLGKDDFILPPGEYSPEEIDQIITQQTNAGDFDQFADLVSAYTYKEKYENNLPKMVSQQTVTYHNINYADCTDTVLRMLTNIVTYQKNIGRLGVIPIGLTVSPIVQSFYKESELNRKSSEVGNREVHQAWAKVSSNLSGCAYKRISDGTSATVTDHDGFIPVDNNFEELPSGKIKIDGAEYDPYNLAIGDKIYRVAQKEVENQKYILIPKKLNLVCCEMRSNILNIINGLNHIFNLNLYSNINEIFEPNFISEKFKEICNKFNWHTSIDATMLNKEFFSIPVITQEGKFNINIDVNHHGSISVEKPKKLTVDLVIPDTTQEEIVSTIISLNFKNIDDLPTGLQNQLLLFYKNVDILHDPNFQNEFIMQMINSEKSFTDLETNYIKSLLFTLVIAGDMPRLTNIMNVYNCRRLLEKGISKEFILEIFNVYQTLHHNYKSLELSSSLIKNHIVDFQHVMPLFEKGFNDSNETIKQQVIDSFINLVQHLMDINLINISQPLPLIQKGLNDSDENVRQQFLLLLYKLINHNLITTNQMTDVFPLLEKGINDTDSKNALDAMSTLSSLVSKNILSKDQLSQCLSLIATKLQHSNLDIRTMTLNLLMKLSHKILESNAEVSEHIAREKEENVSQEEREHQVQEREYQNQELVNQARRIADRFEAPMLIQP